MEREKVVVTRKMFHALSILRRSCTCTEWIKAVAVSQGKKDTFSTGSQAQ